MEFEWDDEKARANLAKHGVPFAYAQLVFADDNRIEELDDLVAYGEERWTAIGLIRNQFFAVVYTQRGSAYRIISARRATRHEQQDYLQQTSS
jgi:uncharacterized protein